MSILCKGNTVVADGPKVRIHFTKIKETKYNFLAMYKVQHATKERYSSKISKYQIK